MKARSTRRKLKDERPAPAGRKTVVISVSLDPKVNDPLRAFSKKTDISISQIVETLCRMHVVEDQWDADCWQFANNVWRKNVQRSLSFTSAELKVDPDTGNAGSVDIMIPKQSLAIISSLCPHRTHALLEIIGTGALLAIRGMQLALVTPSPRLMPVDWREALDKSGILVFDVDNVLNYLANRKVKVGNDSAT